MRAEIRPEPTPQEREVLLAALEDAVDDAGAPDGGGGWRASALDVDDDYDATGRPRRRLGATRA